MTGPCIGALLSQIDTSIYGLPINADNAPGFMILVATFISFVQVSFGLMSLYLQLVILDAHANNTRVRLFYSLTAKAVSLVGKNQVSIPLMKKLHSTQMQFKMYQSTKKVLALLTQKKQIFLKNIIRPIVRKFFKYKKTKKSAIMIAA